MDLAAAAVRERVDVPILTQRDLPKPALVARFAADEATCVFATAGFFQGIDVPGRTLSLVVVDRLPFPRPDDPLLSARREAVGPTAFSEIDIPRAAMMLAQAAGRLIRTSTDRGVVAVLDRRLGTRPLPLGDRAGAAADAPHARAGRGRGVPGRARRLSTVAAMTDGTSWSTSPSTDEVVTITLDSPANRNALSPAARRRPQRGARRRRGRGRRRATGRVIVLTHVAPAFCAGADLKERRTGPPDSAPMVGAMKRLMDCRRRRSPP